jgi:hypothetical protein
LLGDGDFDVHRFLASAVEVDGAAVDAVGNARDRFAHQALGAAADLSGDRCEIFYPFARHQFAERAGSGFAGGDLRGDVAEHLVGEARVGADDRLHVAIPLPAAEQQERRQAQPFLEHLARVGGPEGAADVGHVRDAAGPGDEFSIGEDRRHDRRVRQVP